jgi:hypothetical protein
VKPPPMPDTGRLSREAEVRCLEGGGPVGFGALARPFTHLRFVP